MGQLDELSIVITGASSGIGLGIARRFADEGALLTLGSRSAPPDLPNATWVKTDVSDAAAAGRLLEHAAATHGAVDVLINNAGVQVEKTVAETTDAEFDLVMGVNVRGVFNCSRAAVRIMQTQGGGSIINIGSIAGDTADHGMAVYNASKAAVHGLTRAIATDHGRDGIRCNAISPGWIATELAEAAFDLSADPEAARAAAVSRHPVGRLGQPNDVASLAVWLAGNESTFVSGSIFTIDGGLTAASPIRPE